MCSLCWFGEDVGSDAHGSEIWSFLVIPKKAKRARTQLDLHQPLTPSCDRTSQSSALLELYLVGDSKGPNSEEKLSSSQNWNHGLRIFSSISLNLEKITPVST